MRSIWYFPEQMLSCVKTLSWWIKRTSRITEAKKLFETVNDPHEWDVAVSYLKKRYGADAVDEAIKIEHLEM